MSSTDACPETVGALVSHQEASWQLDMLRLYTQRHRMTQALGYLGEVDRVRDLVGDVVIGD
jgi:hypothetical protein